MTIEERAELAAVLGSGDPKAMRDMAAEARADGYAATAAQLEAAAAALESAKPQPGPSPAPSPAPGPSPAPAADGPTFLQKYGAPLTSAVLGTASYFVAPMFR
jgi:hypothetical protein